MTQVKPMPHEEAEAASAWVMPWNAETMSDESVRRSVELASMAFRETADPLDPQGVCADLRNGDSSGLRSRRAVAALSLLGACSMALVSLYQLGVLRHLPDPPIRRFDADEVNASSSTFRYGMPDGPLFFGAHAVNVVLAGFGSHARARHMPWVPIIAACKAAVEAVVAAKQVFHRRSEHVERAWCGYRMADAAARFGIMLLLLPEAAHAVRGRFMPDQYRRQP